MVDRSNVLLKSFLVNLYKNTVFNSSIIVLIKNQLLNYFGDGYSAVYSDEFETNNENFPTAFSIEFINKDVNINIIFYLKQRGDTKYIYDICFVFNEQETIYPYNIHG